MTRFRHDCKDGHNCYLDGRFDPADLDGTLPRNSSFGDGDAWAEIDGRFLFIEFKGAGVPLCKGGQTRALNLLAQQPNTTVLRIHAREDGAFNIHDVASVPINKATKTWDEIRSIVRKWGELGSARKWDYIDRLRALNTGGSND